MPIDRHTPGDEFDRNDEARVKTGADACTDTGIEKSGRGTNAKIADRKVTAGKNTAGKGTAGKAKPKTAPTGVKRRAAAATDTDSETPAGKSSAGKASVGKSSVGKSWAGKASVGKASGRRKAARKTAQNRAGRTARSKEAALKEMAQQHLVAKRTGETAEERSAPDAGKAGKTALEATLKSRRTGQVGQGVAGQGIIWSLLALGLAACGGGTNTIRVTGGVDPKRLSADPKELKEARDQRHAALQLEAGTVMFVGDGPIKDATVWIDSDGDGVLDYNKDTQLKVGGVAVRTDLFGRFILPKNIDPATILVDTSGGYDVGTDTEVSTGQTFRTVKGGTAFTPLTTLLRMLADSVADDEEGPAAQDAARVQAHPPVLTQ